MINQKITLGLVVLLFLLTLALYNQTSQEDSRERWPGYRRRWLGPRARYWNPRRRRWIYNRPPGWYYQRYYDGGPWFDPYPYY